jgi:S-DNA-T family DNA segregation ATPase FtsK/SpoIIIE
MAAPSIPRRARFDLAEFFARRASEALGVLLCVAALMVAASLWGYDAGDPSLNHATSNRINNPLGALGANIADLALQTVGLAIWFLVLVLPIWGVRLIIDRLPGWTWLSMAALPPALLALAAYLATFGVPPEESWPYLVGLGGVVGDFALHRLEPAIGNAYGLYAALSALALCLIAIGVSIPEAIRSFQFVTGRGDQRQRPARAPAKARADSRRARAGPALGIDEGPSIAGRLCPAGGR